MTTATAPQLTSNAALAVLSIDQRPEAKRLYARWKADLLTPDDWQRIHELVGVELEPEGWQPPESLPTVQESREMRSSKGLVVHTTLRDLEAIDVLSRCKTNGFARRLYETQQRYCRLSHDQWVWVHKFALERLERERNGTASEN